MEWTLFFVCEEGGVLLLPITSVTGETHLLTGVRQVVRKRKVNGEKTLTFLVIPTETNQHSFDTVDNESRIVFKSEPYIIKRVIEKNVGETSIKQVEAVHVFFNDLINCFQYETHSGSQTFFAALQRVFAPTGYTFSIIDSFLAESFENFGQDNCLALFKKVLERYGAEFYVVGSRVYLKRQIGEDTGYQLRWKKNVKSIEKEVDTEGLATVIRGFGGEPDDSGTYPVEREYRSPNESVFGELHASAVYDERITTISGMDDRLQKELMDEPQLSITVGIAEIDGDVKNEGDRGFIIYEPMNIKVQARAVEIDETFEYFKKDWQVIQTAVTLANLRNLLTDVTTRFANTSKRVDRLFEGRESLPYNVLPEAIRLAAEAINNSLTEIKYPPGQGIILQDPDNELNLVRLTSAGIGLSTDGGITYRTAMTGAGIVTNELVAGIIRTNNIQIVGEDDKFFWNGEGIFAFDSNDPSKFVRLNSEGLYIAKGAMTIERPDGYKVINNGIAQADYAIGGHRPAFKDAGIEEGLRTFRTMSTTYASFDYISFVHDSRYLRLRVGAHSTVEGVHTHFRVQQQGAASPLTTFSTTNSAPETSVDNTVVDIVVDLGVPTGADINLYLQMASGGGGSTANVRILRMSKGG